MELLLPIAFLTFFVGKINEFCHGRGPKFFKHCKVFCFTAIIMYEVAGLGIFMDAMKHQNIRVVEEISLPTTDFLPCLPVKV